MQQREPPQFSFRWRFLVSIHQEILKAFFFIGLTQFVIFAVEGHIVVVLQKDDKYK